MPKKQRHHPKGRLNRLPVYGRRGRGPDDAILPEAAYVAVKYGTSPTPCPTHNRSRAVFTRGRWGYCCCGQDAPPPTDQGDALTARIRA